ncbi:MAG: hypothetical protein ABF289_07040 [Clostridiales bacterium]
MKKIVIIGIFSIISILLLFVLVLSSTDSDYKPIKLSKSECNIIKNKLEKVGYHKIINYEKDNTYILFYNYESIQSRKWYSKSDSFESFDIVLNSLKEANYFNIRLLGDLSLYNYYKYNNGDEFIHYISDDESYYEIISGKNVKDKYMKNNEMKSKDYAAKDIKRFKEIMYEELKIIDVNKDELWAMMSYYLNNSEKDG